MFLLGLGIDRLIKTRGLWITAWFCLGMRTWCVGQGGYGNGSDMRMPERPPPAYESVVMGDSVSDIDLGEQG